MNHYSVSYGNTAYGDKDNDSHKIVITQSHLKHEKKEEKREEKERSCRIQ
jgi:hypothetical protein